MEIQVLSNDLEQTRKQVWKNDKKLEVPEQQKDGDDRSLQTQVCPSGNLYIYINLKQHFVLSVDNIISPHLSEVA